MTILFEFLEISQTLYIRNNSLMPDPVELLLLFYDNFVKMEYSKESD